MKIESKRERFIRVAEARTNKIIEMVKLLGNCSSKTVYEYTDVDISKIFGAIDKELKLAKSKYDSTVKNDKFSLR